MFDPLRRVFGHEELFVDRYDQLLRTALRVTEGDRQAAEDLVQDAYIRFTLVQPPLEDVERLDAYFYVMLRNMHTSRVRRRGRTSEVSLSILNFDSLGLGLEALDSPGRMEARQTLYAACEYGCIRRHSSKAGSLFLLRFFHGYLPGEIAMIAGLSTAMVDDQVYRARREAAVFVNHPGQLAFIDRDATARTQPPSMPEGQDGSEETLVGSLRARIFTERHAPCWSTHALRELYRGGRTEALTREQLAAVVCCPVCLDEINSILNLPRLASRWPTDRHGPGTRGGGRTDRSSSELASARQRKRAVFEHRPHGLHVFANGFELGSHTLGSPRGELVITVNIGEPVALVEVFSDQDVCLLFLDVSPPPHGPVRQRRCVELSEGRRAELEVTFRGAWPTVTITYCDPRVAATAGPTRDLVDHDLGARETETVASINTLWTRLFGLHPSPVLILVGALLVWLLFWTPGMQVSAAERIADTIKWLVAELIGPPTISSSLPAPPPAAPAAPAASESPAPRPAVVASPKAARLTPTRRTALELQAIWQLQQVNAYLGQEVSFGSSTGPRVELRAVVESQERKDTLRRALASVVGTRELRLEIQDLLEASNRVRPLVGDDGPPSQRAVFTRDQFPMFEPLQDYFRHQQEREHQGANGDTPPDDAQIEARARRFAMRLLDHSRRASQHAWALQHLTDRFTPAMIRAASADTHELWHIVMREHARGYRQEIALVRSALEPVMPASVLVDSEPPDASLSAAGELPDSSARVGRLLDLQKTQDAAIRAAFAVRSEGIGVSLVQTPAFWRLLDESDALAGDIVTPPSQ